MKSPKILIVEDEATIALDIELSVQDLGYQIVGLANNYEKAIELFTSHTPDVVLLDVHLKNSKSGIEIAKTIRENSKVAIVFLTAFSDQITFEEAKSVVPDGFVNKPFKTNELRNAIEIALHKNEHITTSIDYTSYFSVLDKLKTPAIITNETLDIKGINESFEREYGYIYNDLEAKNIKDLLLFTDYNEDVYNGDIVLRNKKKEKISLTRLKVMDKAQINYLFIKNMPEQLNNPTILLGEKPKIEDSIFIKDRSDYHKVNLNDILWIAAMDNYTTVHTANKKYVVNSFLSEFEKQLPDVNFVRVHRSYIVPILKIEKITEIGAVIEGEVIPVSKSKKKELMQLLKVV